VASLSHIASRFGKLDVHDDVVESVEVIPAKRRGLGCTVQVTLFRPWLRKRRLLRFTNCANVGITIDATVLVDNLFGNTSRAEASTKVSEIRAVMRRHNPFVNVTYERTIDPFPPKLAAAGTFAVFRLYLFGGTLELVAKSFSCRQLTIRSSGPLRVGTV